MKFEHPIWLWILLAVPVIYISLSSLLDRRKRNFERFANSEVWQWIAPELDWNAKKKKLRTLALAFFLLILALAQPQWGVHEETVQSSGIDVMIVMDLSQSMYVEDVIPSRLKKSRHMIRNMASRLDGDRIGVIGFAGSAYVACPLTTDMDYVVETVDTLGPQMISNQGTDIGLGLETAVRALDRAAEEPQQHSGNQAQKSSKAIILITDGEDQEEQTETAAKKIRADGIQFYVLGIGTQKGGPIPLRDEQGVLRTYKKDSKGSSIVSSFHPESLEKLASSAGGKYWSSTEGESELDELLQSVGALDRKQFAERKIITYQERYQIPLFLAVLILMLELSLPAYRKVSSAIALPVSPPKSKKNKKASTIELTSPLLILLGMAGFFLLKSNSAHATPPLDVYLNNQKGVDAFKDGKVEEAREQFGKAQARDPNLPELYFNQGVIQAQEESYDQSAQGFLEAAKGAAQSKNPKLESQSYFNLGNVLAKKGDTQKATQSYLEAMRAARDAHDEKLEGDARKNLQLLAEQPPQNQGGKGDPKSGQGGGSDSKDQQQQNQGDDKNKSGQQNSKDNQQGSGNQNQRFKDSDSKSQRKKNFQSPKLSQEDADRVMAELSAKERELNAKLKKQKGNPSRNLKDW